MIIWQAQGAPGYRTTSALLSDRSPMLADPDGAVDAIVLRHLLAFGLASRHDLLDVLAPDNPPDLRLLTEFDSLLYAYDAKTRDRYVPSKHYWRLAGSGSEVSAGHVTSNSPTVVDGERPRQVKGRGRPSSGRQPRE